MSLLSPQLEAFMAVVKHKTVHGAAEAIFLTQTAVTQRIRALEHRLGTTLFKRTRRGMEPTQEAEALIRYCQSALALEGEALAAIQGKAENSAITLTLFGPTSIMHARVVGALHRVMQKHPHLLMHFEINDTETGHKALKNGMCDLAIIHKELVSPEMQTKALEPEEYILIAPKAWAHRELIDIVAHERIVDFNPEDQVTFNYLKKYGLFERAKVERHLANRPEMMAELIKNGLGYGTLSREFAKIEGIKEHICILNEGQSYLHELVLAWYDRPTPPAYFKAVIQAIC